MNSWYLSDQESGNKLNSGNSAVGFKSEQNWGAKTVISPYVGYQREEDRGIVDYGWDFGLEARGQNYRFSDYETSLNLQTEYDIFPNRRNVYHEIGADVITHFSGYTYDDLKTGFMTDRKQYYGPLDREIIDLSINNIFMDNRFFYSVSGRSDIAIRTILRDRKLNDNEINKRNVSYFENRFDYNLSLNDFVFRAGVYTLQESQDNTDITTDNKTSQTSLASSVEYLLGLHDQLRCDLYYIKFQYDTPDSLINHNDRDEQRYIGTLRYYHRFSPLLYSQSEFSFDLYHRIYVFKEMSANNSWNRIVRFSSSLVYEYRQFKNRFQSGVLANYTVYDYENILRTKQSYVFRKYYISDSLYIPLKQNIFFCTHTTIELRDRGTFYSEQFAQYVSNESICIYLDLFIREKFGRWFNYDAGVLLYQREDYSYEPSRQRIWKEFSYTPFLNLLYPLGRHVRFVASIYYRILTEMDKTQRAYTKGQLNLNYFF